MNAAIFLVTLLLVGSFIASSNADEPAPRAVDDSSLIGFAVHIDRMPKQPWPGFGIYLGNGYVLTAAHVAGDLALTSPRVVVAGKSLAAQSVREGTFDGDDLTFLRVDASQLPQNLRSAHVTLCSSEPPLGSKVIVVTPEGAAESSLVAPGLLSHDILSRYPTLIGDVASTGNSGSGVFDKVSRCLLGIMSRKLSLQGFVQRDGHKEAKTVDIAKYFVGFDAIKKAMPAAVRF